MFTAIIRFADLQDGKHIYEIGDEYPRKGYSPTNDRIEELLSDKNALHMPIIQRVEVPEEEPKKRNRRKKSDD